MFYRPNLSCGWQRAPGIGELSLTRRTTYVRFRAMLGPDSSVAPFVVPQALAFRAHESAVVRSAVIGLIRLGLIRLGCGPPS